MLRKINEKIGLVGQHITVKICVLNRWISHGNGFSPNVVLKTAFFEVSCF